MKGFFEPSQAVSKAPVGILPKCGACGLLKGCQSPKIPLHGNGRMKILVVGEAPGATEDEQGRPFVGDAGQQLRNSLDKFGIDLDEDCWTTNALACRPPKNRTPTAKEIEYCRPLVMQAINQLKPEMIIPLGVSALKSVLGSMLEISTPRGSRPSLKSKWSGWCIPFQKWNCWICPNYHLRDVIESKEDRDGPVVKLLFESYLERALTHVGGRPFTTIPDYAKEVRIVMDPNEVARYIDKWIEQGGNAAFDYETNRLKPDADNARIKSCAICYKGKQTIAYPMVGAAIAATRRFLVSDLGKIGANAKFEDRWSRRILGVSVNNWIWDTMLSAHHLDNRPGICGVDFQAFVRLGQLAWDDHIHPYLKSADASGLNRIDQLDIRDLLIYNGIDSLVEYKIAQLQRKEMMNERA